MSRRYSTLFFLLASVIALPAHAFTGLAFGLGGGASIAKISDGLSTPYTNRTGLALGANLNISLSEHFSLAPEAMYIQKGAKLGSTTINLSYLEVPVLLKWQWDFGILYPSIFVGPSLAFNISNTIDTAAGSANYPIASEDYGLHMGVGIEIPFGLFTRLFINSRYILGLKDIENGAGTSQKNRTVLVMGGLEFVL